MKHQTLTTIAALSIMAISSTACYKAQFKNPGASRGQKHEMKQTFFLWGAAGGGQIDLNTVCPGGVAEINTQASFVDMLLYGATGGIYAPHSVEVYCQGGTAFRLDKAGNRTLSINLLSE